MSSSQGLHHIININCQSLERKKTILQSGATLTSMLSGGATASGAHIGNWSPVFENTTFDMTSENNNNQTTQLNKNNI